MHIQGKINQIGEKKREKKEKQNYCFCNCAQEFSSWDRHPLQVTSRVHEAQPKEPRTVTNARSKAVPYGVQSQNFSKPSNPYTNVHVIL